MCNMDCDVVFGKGICGLEWQLLNFAVAAQLGMLCARLPLIKGRITALLKLH